MAQPLSAEQIHRTLQAIAKLISQDPGLSGALLKIVNSPFFGRPSALATSRRMRPIPSGCSITAAFR